MDLLPRLRLVTGCSRARDRPCPPEPGDAPAAPDGARGGDVAPLAALTLAWSCIVLIVDPRGGFPLNDDWAYGRVALALAEHGRFEPSFWQSMPLLTHALWGAAWARLFGASWFALRLSSLTAGWLALVGTYFLLREIGWRRARATAGAATLLVNPWLVALSFTFMTDVPFTATVVWGAWAWMRAVGRCDGRWLALAALLGVTATLNRQLGLALPLAFALPVLRRRAFGRWSWAAALAPVAAAALALAAHDHLRHTAAVSAALYDEKSRALVSGALGLFHLHGSSRTGGRVVAALVYLGLFALPMTIAAGASATSAAHGRARGPVTYTLGALAGLAVLAGGWSMPLLGNIVVDFGIGPRTLAGQPAAVPAWIWPAITMAAAVGAAFLVRLLVEVGRRGWRCGGLDGPRWKPMAALAAAATLFLPSAIADAGMFDRHLLPLLPLLLASLPAGSPGAGDSRPARAVAITAASLVALTFTVFSVAGTHDYLAWQRARWKLVRAAEASPGVAPWNIRAGFEIDNLEDARRAAATSSPRRALADRTSARFVIASAPLPDHREVLRADVQAWLPGAVRAVYLLAR